jgi:hypothetical protein
VIESGAVLVVFTVTSVKPRSARLQPIRRG